MKKREVVRLDTIFCVIFLGLLMVLFSAIWSFAKEGGEKEGDYEVEEVLVIGTPLDEVSVIQEEVINIPTLGSSLLDALESQAGVQLMRVSPTHRCSDHSQI
jgi:hypothetical protein